MKDQLKIILKKHGIHDSDELLKDLVNTVNHAPNELVEKYNLLFNHSYLSYQSLDINGHILEVNPTWLKVLAYKKEEVIGKWFGDFLHTDYVNAFKEQFEQFKKDGKVEDVRFRMKKNNGEIILVLFKGYVLYNPNGEFKCTYCSFVDITQEKNTLNKLKESEEKFRTITNSAQDVIILIDSKGEVVFWNKAAEKTLLYKEKEVIGKNLHEIITPSKYMQAHKKAFKEFIKTGKGNAIDKTLELSAIRKDGVEIPIELSLSALKLNDSWHSVGIIRDISERKLRENQLIESEDKYRKLVDIQGEGIAISDENEIFKFSNPAADKIFGVKKGGLIGKSLQEFLLPDEQEKIKQETVKRKKGSKSSYELKIVRPDGNIRFIQTTVVPEIDNKGNFLNSFGIFRDITKQKEIENKLTESEERFKNLSHLTFEGIVFHENAIVTDCNDSFLKLFKYERNEIINSNLLQIIHPDYHHKIKENIVKEVAEPYEVLGVKKDGTVFPIEIEARNVILNKKTIRVAAVRDITERKIAQSALLESETKYNSLFSSMSEGVVLHELVYDEKNIAIDYIIVESNKAFEDHTGIQIKKNNNHLASEFYKTNPAPYLDIYTRVAETSEPANFETYFPPLKKHFNISVFSPKKGWFATVFQDITDRKKYEQKLKENNEELHHLNATKDKFFSIIAHDLRGPISNLVGFSDLLERNHLTYKKEKLSYMINLMSTSAKRTNALLENLLIWSHSQSNKISFNPQTYICKELISEVIQEMEHLAFAKDIILKTDTENKEHTVFVDKDMFKAVFRNLISNAIKFTKEGGVIYIGCNTKNDHFVEFFVKDTGIGIPKNNLQKLFKIDKNITTEGTNKERGTGLGLVLCNDFIEKHGGKIWVKSKINEGSTFFFTFPVSEKNKS